MKAVIEIDMDNAAFDRDPSSEVANILLDLVGKLRNCRIVLDARGEAAKIRDINGNVVGKVVVR